MIQKEKYLALRLRLLRWRMKVLLQQVVICQVLVMVEVHTVVVLVPQEVINGASSSDLEDMINDILTIEQ